jgi:hypothetical protein
MVAESAASVVAVGAIQKIDGGKLYANNCSGCHGAAGEGGGSAFPPLASNTVVSGAPANVIHILKCGLGGAINVAGKTYDSNAGLGRAIKRRPNRGDSVLHPLTLEQPRIERDGGGGDRAQAVSPNPLGARAAAVTIESESAH